MANRILLVEPSDATRGLVESLLRQHGYEVISVSSADKALEVIQHSHPDLIILNADAKSGTKFSLLESLDMDSRTSSISKLVFVEEGSQCKVPEDISFPIPFEPEDFLKKLNKLLSSSTADRVDEALNDELVDAALGLDRLEVTSSSELKDQEISTIKGSAGGKKGGYEKIDDDSNSGGSRVESVIIRDDDADIVVNNNKPPARALKPSEKLDIVDDQYGIAAAEEAARAAKDSQVHDYDWFINEMRNEVNGTGEKPQPPKQIEVDEEDVFFEQIDHAAAIDPYTPAPGETPGKKKNVDNFIEEFKKEVEKIDAKTPESVVIKEDKAPKSEAKKLDWEEKLENISVEQMEIFTRQLSKDIAAALAIKIASKLDSDKLLSLIKREILERISKK